MLKNLWNKFVAWIKNVWSKFMLWFISKPFAWFKKNWFMVANYFVILIAYDNTYDKIGVGLANIFLGLWIFTSIAFAGWKWFNK